MAEQDWKAGYLAALARYFAANGSIPAEREDTFGWEDFRATEKMRRHDCGPWAIVGDVTEHSYYAFAGTFTGLDHKYLATARLTCRCRRYKEQEVRMDSNLSDVIMGVVGA